MASSDDNLNGGNNETTNTTSNYATYTLDGRGKRKHRHAPENQDTEIPIETEKWNDWTSTWRKIGNSGHSKDVTLTGTITRGKKKGQTVDVQLDLTNQELMDITQSNDNIESRHSASNISHSIKEENCQCNAKSGPHIVILGILCFPFVFIASFFTSFYFGALTWQNVFNYFYDEGSIWQRIFICPPLVILFPLLILVFSLSIAVYAAFAQFWWSFDGWKSEVSSFEKGFFSWFCDKINLEECCPYQVVELNCPEEDVDSSRERILHNTNTNRNDQFESNQIVPLNNMRTNETMT